MIVARSYADHHLYSSTQLDALLTEAAGLGLTPVTTQKDFVRLPRVEVQKVTALPVAMRFDDERKVVAILAETLAQRRAAFVVPKKA